MKPQRVTTVLWFTGKSSSPLFNLYLLPIILSALTLGRVVTLLQVAIIAVCHFMLAATTPGDSWASTSRRELSTTIPS